MKQTPLRRKTAMTRGASQLKRSSMVRTLLMPSARGDESVKTLKVWKSLKSSGPKMTPIRKSANGEECTFNLQMVCSYDREAVVWCHENSYEAGKGMGKKSEDHNGAYGCSKCHDVYDRRVPLPNWLTWEQVEQAFAHAKAKSRQILRRKGLLGAEK